jgi:hypothetical protein
VSHPVGPVVTNGHTSFNKSVAASKNVNTQYSASTLEDVPLSTAEKENLQDPS